MHQSSKVSRFFWVVIALLLGGSVLFWFRGLRPGQQEPFPTNSGYYAFFLQNNLVVYAKAGDLGKPQILLKDVYYVRTNVNPQTKEVSSNVIKRGSEWHAPDQMLVNANNVILIEPVDEHSRVAKLIRGNAEPSK
ncbi:MAG: hypothetical protein WD696_08090 [Bryobacteraceae bacterium]